MNKKINSLHYTDIRTVFLMKNQLHQYFLFSIKRLVLSLKFYFRRNVFISSLALTEAANDIQVALTKSSTVRQYIIKSCVEVNQVSFSTLKYKCKVKTVDRVNFLPQIYNFSWELFLYSFVDNSNQYSLSTQ